MTGPSTSDVTARADRVPEGWVTVCPLDRIPVEGGVTALVDGAAVAVFRTHDDTVHALSNYDPFGKASVLSRGIVGTRTVDGEEVAFVASPLLKQAFDLRTGTCLDDPEVRVPTYDVQVQRGSERMVLVGPRRRQQT
ncbi:nitrite reductase small subunit NirD [Nocardioides panacisoli]|uniref:nitrite reductase small subunit NirD n=1 Tax=Nocardioides panacisoli TaxID=627624 RepID=UPI001C62D4A3|nr:nitrite reductase small subunit NirD [Nocardioides panacisoli]QYJ03146.1 nitrite reductase small subunit NirD [Nocardioides panacisoli]